MTQHTAEDCLARIAALYVAREGLYARFPRDRGALRDIETDLAVWWDRRRRADARARHGVVLPARKPRRVPVQPLQVDSQIVRAVRDQWRLGGGRRGLVRELARAHGLSEPQVSRMVHGVSYQAIEREAA